MAARLWNGADVTSKMALRAIARRTLKQLFRFENSGMTALTNSRIAPRKASTQRAVPAHHG
jgi:hypothetical protein